MLKITIPYPHIDLNPNRARCLHWGKLSKIRSAARNEAYYEAKAAIGDAILNIEGKLEVSIDFYPPNKMRRDLDNAISAFKPYQDGVASALNVDDSRWKPTYDLLREQPLNKVVLTIKGCGA